MALIENLVVAVGMRTEAFKKGIKDIQKDLAGLSHIGKSMFAALFGMETLKQFFGKIIDMTKAFVNTMLETMGMSGKQFSQLAYVATRAGISVEQLDTAFQKMEVTIANAAQGDASSIGIFRRMGKEINYLKNLSPWEMFKQITDGISKAGNAAERMDLTRTVFGRGGSGMINVMAGGVKGLDAIINRGRELNVIFNDIDIAKIVDLRTKWNDVKQAMFGAFASILINAWPVFSGLLTGITDLIIAVRKFGEAWLWSSEVMFLVVTSYMYVGRWINKQITAMTAGIELFGAGIELLSQKMISSPMGIMKAQKEYDKVFKKWQEQLSIANTLLLTVGGDAAKYIEELKSKLQEITELKGENPFDIVKELFPGAVQQHTKEAVEAAAKASSRDPIYEAAVQNAQKTAEAVEQMKAMNDKLGAIELLLNADAGIV